MHVAKYQLAFKPSLWPTVAALIMIALTTHLAMWQQERAAEKRSLQAEFDQRIAAPPITLGADSQNIDSLRFRNAKVKGFWLAEGQIYLDNKTDGGTAGYHVITPLKLIERNVIVLVNRGWVARSPSYPVPPEVAVQPGLVDVVASIAVPTAKFIELSPQGIQTDVWQNLTIERYRKHTGLNVLPFLLIATDVMPAQGKELQMLKQHPNAGVEKHVEYMLTWYSLAVTIVIFWIVLNFKITRRVESTSFPAGNAP